MNRDESRGISVPALPVCMRMRDESQVGEAERERRGGASFANEETDHG